MEQPHNGEKDVKKPLLTRNQKIIVFGSLSCLGVIGLICFIIWILSLLYVSGMVHLFDKMIVPTETTCEMKSNSASGYLIGPGEYCSWTVTAHDETVSINVSVENSKSDFWLQIKDASGVTMIAEYEIWQDMSIPLPGAGTYWLIIYSKGGSGPWEASWE
ncbi:MAG: hypothetical protein JW885_15340 [Deltaproteobacteria bacterium]|nr:hypothetical protein [Candidatus Zymogenaceae bacterium]